MSTGFWGKLNKPIIALAPMANVTDAAFRFIIAKYSKFGGRDIIYNQKESLPAEAKRVGGPDVMWTEFVSADGLCSAGREKLLPDFWFTEAERPIVAQIFGAKPEVMARAAELVAELGFDGVDINMGCPDRGVERQGAGAALIKDPELAQKIILSVKNASGLPVSVKTRLGYNKVTLDEWLPRLLETGLVAVTIHARTRKEMSAVPAHWERIVEAVHIRDKYKSQTLILGNGDAASLEEAKKLAAETGCDGIMIGRGIFGNPWLFSPISPTSRISLKARFDVILEHTKLFEKLFAGVKNFEVMKKHYKAYVAGFDGAKELRTKLMAAKTLAEVEALVAGFTAV